MVRVSVSTVLALLGVALAGCEPVPPSGEPFSPSRPPESRADGAEARLEPKPGEFDFEADARPSDETSTGPASYEELLEGQGLSEQPADVSAAEPGIPAPPAVAAPEAPPPTPAWTPAPVSWGVRLVATVPDAQPPRAILGFADGREAVVQPGSLLPEARVVVLAIGRDVVQIAEVTPEGDHARVETQMLTALQPGRPEQP